MENVQEDLSLIIPCYNEEENIAFLYQGLIPVLRNLHLIYRIWFIDDGSTDKTLSIIKRISETDHHIRYLSFSRNFGHQKALRAGIDHANGKVVIMMDADVQHPASLIPQMLQKWRAGFQVVNTIRRYNHTWSFLKIHTSRLFYKFINSISDIEITPYSPDFRLLDRKVVLALRQCKEEHLFLRGLVKWCGFKQTEIYFQDGDRHAGKTKYTWSKMISLATYAITSFSIKPLRAAILFSLFFILLSIIETFYVLYIAFYTTESVPGWASLAILISLLGGITLLMLGIIGEYIGKAFMQGKDRPLYLIKEISEKPDRSSFHFIYRKGQMERRFRKKQESQELQMQIDTLKATIGEDNIRHQQERERFDEELASLQQERENKDKRIKQLETMYKAKNISISPAEAEAAQIFLKIINSGSYTPATDRENLQHWLDIVHQGFATSLNARYPSLSEREKDICYLAVLNLPVETIAHLLKVQPRSVEKYILRVCEKVGLKKKSKEIFVNFIASFTSMEPESHKT